MTSKTALLKQAAAQADVQDHNEVSKFSGASLPEAGKAPARLVSYIEIGTHPQDAFKGQAKDPCAEVRLTFEVFGKKNTDTIEVDGKEKTIGRRLTLQNLTIKLNEKAKFYKLFQAMRAGRPDIKNMAQMLDEVFLVDIIIGEGKKTKRKYATIWTGSSYNIGAPVVEQFDEEGNVTGTINLTEKTQAASLPHQLFVVNSPSLEQWESIYIDGAYTRKIKDEAGKETGEEEEVSKNFLQEQIIESLDWEGSAMQTLLLGLKGDETTPTLDTKPAGEALEDPVDPSPVEEGETPEKAPVAKAKPKAKAKPAAKKAAPVEEDDTAALLAECGL